jgi:hypothetical protein
MPVPSPEHVIPGSELHRRPAAERARRRAIWQRRLPAKLPVADDLNLDVLSRAELTGGEIKNVVLNAARPAAQRSRAGPVMMADFHEAVAMEVDGL